MNDCHRRLTKRAIEVWTLTVLTAAVYWSTLGRFPPTEDDFWFFVWAAVVALGTASTGAWAMGRSQSWNAILGLAALPAVGFVTAYVAALFTYGSGAEDGIVWRGIGGGVIGVISAVVALLLLFAHRRSARPTLPASPAMFNERPSQT